MRMEMIRLEHVTKSFGRYKALDDVSIVVEEGEFLTVIGRSGRLSPGFCAVSSASFHRVILPSNTFAMVAASMLMCLPASETPCRLNTMASGEMYTGTSNALARRIPMSTPRPVWQSSGLSEAAHTVAPGEECGHAGT